MGSWEKRLIEEVSTGYSEHLLSVAVSGGWKRGESGFLGRDLHMWKVNNDRHTRTV